MVLKLTLIYSFIFFPFNVHGYRKPRETHFPGYHFCGPGTNFLKRTSLGQLGVNKLDEACRLHDMVYTNSVDLYLRTEADKQLEMQAWERVTAPDSSYKEKFAAWMVTNIMKLKRKWNTRRLRSERKKNKSCLTAN
ncbi:uncharacterized protein LOC112687920 [Sipha flava]|uniref:Uncharacterized protein LOC112687920 n=1 Tax=Sipha flava TaxID=143950 RepID=A0A2S2QY97_9HEMI|nr:uncharacterized protein LOC112687920 [Sipha flava]